MASPSSAAVEYSAQADVRPEISIVMPCLNEAETLDVCLQKALTALRGHGIRGEVIVADNGSTDGSQEIAARRGVRVVNVTAKGYGSALLGGIAAARGAYVMMGDADDSYDFSHVDRFLQELRATQLRSPGMEFASENSPWNPGTTVRHHVAALLVVTALQVLGPLRIDTDGWVYLLTQLVLNAPEGRIPGFRYIGYLVGLVPAALILLWFYRQWHVLDAIYVYLAGYIAILAVSPWPASRYWLPILPLVASVIFKTMPRRTNRHALVIYCVAYCAMGLASIAYCTRITFAGPRFPELFGTREDRADYQKWMGETVTGRVDPVHLELLNRYAGKRSNGN